MNAATKLPGELGPIHFVGIGGIGMSGIAEVLMTLGYTVQGSDAKRSKITDRLESLGATVFEGQRAENVGDAGVVVISTGSELREPGTELGHDSIYDGNSYLLAAAARAAGEIAYRVGIVPDDPRTFVDTLSDQLVRADLVVTSGGVSQGDYDVVKEALSSLGSVWFGPVAMQPVTAMS